MEIPNCAHSFFLTSTFHHLTPPSFNRTWFWRSWDRDSVSTSYLSSWRERTKYLALDFLSSFVYTWFVPTFRVKWRSYWVWLERSRWFYPKSLKHWYGLLNWLLWYLHIIFFSFLSFPFSSCRLWLLTIDFVSPAFSLVYFFPWSFLHLFLYFEKFHSLFLCPDSDCYLVWLATHIIALSCCTLICLHLEVLPCVPTSDSILYTWLCLLFHSVCYTASHHLWLA